MSKIGALSADRLCRSTLGGCSICTDHCTGIHQRIRFRAFVTDTERQATSQARALEKFGPSVFPAGALAVGDMTEESQPLLRPKARYFQRISFAALSARKPLQQILSEEKDGSQQNAGLKRSISLIELIAFGVGCTIGSGIYALVGIGAQKAGPAVFASYIIGAISCVLTGLAYAEFAVRFPVTGSAYTYVYVVFGELWAWMVGWNLTLEYSIGSAVIARSWVDYLRLFLESVHASLPEWLYELPIGSTSGCILAAVMIIIATEVALLGVKESMYVNMTLTALNVAILLFFIVVGASRVKPDNWTTEGGTIAPFGAGAIFSAAGTVFFSFLGFDMVSSLAEEVKKPKRDMPVGIVGSLAICAGLYVAVALVLTGMVPFELLNHTAPLTQALELKGLSWAAKLVGVAAIVALSATVLTGLVGQPRIFYRMSRDGLLFPFFSSTKADGEIPVWGTLITGAVTALIALFTPEELLADAISIGTLMAFSMVDGALIILRLQPPPAAPDAPAAPLPKRPVLLLVLYAALAFAASLCYAYKWSIIATLSIAACACGPFVFLHMEKEDERSKQEQLARNSFRCPFVPTFPLLGIAVNLNMLAGLNYQSWIRLAAWTGIGLSIYFLYGYHRSALRPRATDPRHVVVNSPVE